MAGTVDRDEVIKIVDDRFNEIQPQVIEIVNDDKTVKIEGLVHEKFEAVMDIINEGEDNIMLGGPAGTGKSTLAKNVADALELDYGFISLSMGVTETHIFGRLLPQKDGSWDYADSPFVRIYENGGVFLLDEVDAADPNVMVSINAALANGMFANPVNGKIHHRHENCYVIAAANTWGRGGDAMYVGRNQLDTATLDRFVLATLHVFYDTKLEAALIRPVLSDEKFEELTAWIAELRKKIMDNRLRRVASTRLVVKAARAMGKGKTLAQCKERYFVDWSKDERSKVGEF
jgi:cobaltochelatase CobS